MVNVSKENNCDELQFFFNILLLSHSQAIFRKVNLLIRFEEIKLRSINFTRV